MILLTQADKPKFMIGVVGLTNGLPFYVEADTCFEARTQVAESLGVKRRKVCAIKYEDGMMLTKIERPDFETWKKGRV